MTRKSAEPKARKFFEWIAHVQEWRSYWRKYKDKTYCPHCHKLLPKSEMMPDFVFAYSPIYVEVKESKADGSFDFKRGFTKDQRNFILSKWRACIFLELGNGMRGTGKMAYFMSWFTWLEFEKKWEERGWSSIRLDSTSRREGVRKELQDYQLEWRDGTWTAPPKHPLWSYLSLTFRLRSPGSH